VIRAIATLNRSASRLSRTAAMVRCSRRAVGSPGVELGVGGDHAAPRVVREAEPAQLPPERRDVGRGGRVRMLAGLERVLLGRQAEGVEPHGVQHVVAGHPEIPPEHVRPDVAERVADVQPGPARIREHVVQVGLRPAGPRGEPLAERAGGVRGVERPLALPPVLPPRLDPRGEGGGVPVRRRVVAGKVAGSGRHGGRLWYRDTPAVT
jgi:hypothetical protein